ncbi:MAG: hypothetical protein O3A85_10395 [Proteobacteria bacterium]|nr:hypothetical protein [Pseudomonadota bacterium]
MVQQVNYEVQVQQNGRWSIHARFDSHEKTRAIEEGRQLDQLPSIEAVKVIKEVFDTEKESTAEFIVFKSATMRSGQSRDSGGGGGGYSRASSAASRNDSWLSDDDDDDDFAEDAKPRLAQRSSVKPKKTSTMTTVIVKLLLVVLFSVLLSAGAAMMVDEMMGGVRIFGIHFVGNAESNLLISVFAFTFLISVTGMAISVMRHTKIDSSSNDRALQKK